MNFSNLFDDGLMGLVLALKFSLTWFFVALTYHKAYKGPSNPDKKFGFILAGTAVIVILSLLAGYNDPDGSGIDPWGITETCKNVCRSTHSATVRDTVSAFLLLEGAFFLGFTKQKLFSKEYKEQV